MSAPHPNRAPSRAPSRAPNAFASAWIVARKDLAIEFRTRSAFLSALVLSLLSLVIFYFA